jgi:hypothetical protein
VHFGEIAPTNTILVRRIQNAHLKSAFMQIIDAFPAPKELIVPIYL